MAREFKPGVIQGALHKESVVINHNGEEFEIFIRPLKLTESSEIKGIAVSALKFEGEKLTGFDAEKQAGIEDLMYLKACAYGTIEKAWNATTINDQWLPEWIYEVGKRVLEISGVNKVKESDVNKFRSSEETETSDSEVQPTEQD